MTDEDRAHYRQRVRALEAFGHRGSATEQERRAADCLALELRHLGLNPELEAFAGSRSFGARLLFHVVVAVAGLGLLWYFPLATTALALLALASLWVEQAGYGIWLSRPLVRFSSANVVARFAPAAAARLRILICGHYDSQRTGWIWRLVGHLTALDWRLPVHLKSPLLPLGLAFAVQAAVGVVALWGVSSTLLAAWWSLLIVYTLFGILFGQWAISPFVPGAADNASGAAAVLTIGEAWRRDPLPGVELVLLLTGCEETGLFGAAAWADQHRRAITAIPTVFLNLDGLGCGPPRFLGWEVPICGLPVAYPRGMIAMAAAVAAEQDLRDAGPHSLPGPTDGLAFLKRGIAGATIVGFQDGGRLPNYHRMLDTSETMDFEAAWAGVRYAWALLGRLATAIPESGIPL